MNLAEFSVKNSLFVNCLALFFVIAGVLAIIRMPREAFPNVNFDVVTVRTNYPGASPEQVEKLITMPLEEELKEVDGIKEMNSVSIENISLVILEIEPDEPNKDRVVTDIQRAVERTNDLPEDLENLPVVSEMKTRDNPIVEVSLSGNLSEDQLRQIADDLETELEILPEVSDIALKGYREKQIWVEVDPAKMRQMEVSLPLIIRALRARNVGVPGGTMTLKDTDFLLRTTGEFETPEEINEVIVRANDQGHWVQIRDVAQVHYALEEETITSHTNGTRAINLVVIKKAWADVITLVEKVEQVTQDYKKKAPAELEVNLVNDMSFYVKRRLNVLKSNGFIGLGLVLIPLLLFLSRRVAFSAAVGMPIALMAAFAMMRFFGVSINLLSMFGMIMVIGMLVDEDVVMAENVHRHLEEGKSPIRAAIEGSLEVTKPLIVTVITTLLAFLPLLLMTGVMGKFVRDIPIVVSIVLTASLLEALIILPSHIADFNRSHSLEKLNKEKNDRMDRWMKGLVKKYGNLLRWCLNKKYWVFGGGTLLSLLAIFYSIFIMKFVLFPAKGIEIFFVRAEAEIGTPLEKMVDYIKPLENFITTLPVEEVDSFVSQIGIQQNDPHDPFTSRGSHLAQIAVYLTPNADRDRTSQEIIDDVRARMIHVPHLTRVDIDHVNPGPPVGKPIAIQIRGNNVATLKSLATTYKNFLKDVEGVRDIRDDFEPGKKELRIVVNEKEAARSQLSIADIAGTVRHAFEGTIATVIRNSDEKINVLVRFPLDKRESRTNLDDLLVENALGLMIPLKAVAHVETHPSIAAIKHLEAERVVSVTANINEDIITSSKANRLLEKEFHNLLVDYPGYTVKYGGEKEDTDESLSSLKDAFLISFILILLVLLMTFKSVLDSWLIMLTIPYGLVGVSLGLTLHGHPFSFMALLGMVGLSGIVVDNAIIMVDFIHKKRREGVESDQAIIEGAQLRLRPVILVTLTTILGVIPSAYGIGGFDPFIQPMALALNYGLAFSAALTIILIPCTLSIMNDLRNVLKHRFQWIKFASGN